MMDYIGAAVLFIFIIAVLAWLWRRERRDRLATEGKLATENQKATKEELATENQQATEEELSSEGQRRDDHG